MNDSERATLRAVADYQFGRGAGTALFGGDDLTVRRTSSGRPQQVLADDGRLVSYGTDGRFTLGYAGGVRLAGALPADRYRVAVGEESAPYLREGRNAFAKFVRQADPAIRPADEVLVVDGEGDGNDLLAVGRAELSGEAMLDFDTGMAVKVREGAPE
ncbi:hypothetical protein BRC83_05960 [Halobacteriales archaeon QS_1_68_17]|nr:MAG: hypothetical protein BRC83_05960 [Halobacteriales archaeon QS_1_68_17]